MNLSTLRDLFRKKEPAPVANLFDSAPFLAPWYFTKDAPAIINNGRKLNWRFIEKVGDEYIGITVLHDEADNILGFVKAYNYIYVLPDASKFLIWNRVTKQETGNPCVIMQLYSAADLTNLDKTDQAILDFHNSKELFRFAPEPISTLKYVIQPSIVKNTFSFPRAFKVFNPFLVVADYEGLYDGSPDFGNTLMLEFDPAKDLITCYKQDWFNKSNVDRGYQWITRAVKDRNGNIHGQGIRISDFVLDKTGTQIKK